MKQMYTISTELPLLILLFCSCFAVRGECQFHRFEVMGTVPGIYRDLKVGDPTPCGGCQCMEFSDGGHTKVYMYCIPTVTGEVFSVDFVGNLNDTRVWLCIEPSGAHSVTKELLPLRSIRIERFVLTNSTVGNVHADAFQLHHEDMEHIDLSHNLLRHLADFVPSMVDLRSLIHLKLNGNRLISLAGDWPLSRLRHLVHLDLANTSLSYREIPPETFPQRLTTLDLSKNSFETLDFLKDQSLLSVARLFLNSNSIRMIGPTTFHQFLNLIELRLEGNGLEDAHFTSDTFYHLNKLQVLDIRNNRLTKLEEAVFSDVLYALKRNVQANDEGYGALFFASENRLVCDCNLGWLRQVEIDNPPDVLCSSPEDMEQYSIYQYPEPACTDVALVAGAAGGGFVLLVVIIAVVCCTCRKRRRERVKKGKPTASPRTIPPPYLESDQRRPTVSSIPGGTLRSIEVETELREVPKFSSSGNPVSGNSSSNLSSNSGNPTSGSSTQGQVYWQVVEEGQYYEVPHVRPKTEPISLQRVG